MEIENTLTVKIEDEEASIWKVTVKFEQDLAGESYMLHLQGGVPAEKPPTVENSDQDHPWEEEEELL